MHERGDDNESKKHLELEHNNQSDRFTVVKVPRPIVASCLPFVAVFGQPIRKHGVVKLFEIKLRSCDFFKHRTGIYFS
ncbi:MAG: hypothetical protein COT25_01665 [Candidatus Kerfeldbacteria bacterium CG08_land_8_20_14_0_20_42_7]|uniref:Uncharacterized protein n=1 Tax=Candidatus Kerfeldbacteria bacterium CG08_land_8_20_14_0_20_42_7 TaxID=2014245 RepID=A0A2H0YT82_9BACT|nr:MAG: hypothetical protein COT25_01665 [Candidatus Kerfeldbacteria bacterium CG08_land_8_20_14_0_20_42_7]